MPLRRLCLFLLLAAPVLADEAIDWTEAPNCIDRVCSLRGTVVAQEDGGPFYRLYFDAERHDVYITLMRGWMVTWPSYVGHTIVATGPVDRWRDHSEMILLTPDAIVFLDAPDTPVPDLTPIAPAPTADCRSRRRPCRSPRRRRRATKWSSYAIASARSKRRSSGSRADIRRRHE